MFFPNIMKDFASILSLAAVGLVSISPQAIASSFSYSSGEVEIYSTNFSESRGWILKGTQINLNNNFIEGASSWGVASYPLAQALNLEQGEINLYWRGIFPANARTESDKYYVGLEYYDNPPVVDNIFGTIDENAAVKMELRPYSSSNVRTNSYNLYIDPDFDPVNNYASARTELVVDRDTNYRVDSPIDFRLNLKANSSHTAYEISPFVWHNGSWQLMTAKTGFSSPLTLSGSAWVTDEIGGQRLVENPVTFETIFLQFRNPGSRVTALALTQNLTKVSEPSGLGSLAILIIAGISLKMMDRRR